MPTPQFVLDLRARVGHMELWLPGATAVVLREAEARTQVLCVQRVDSGEWTPICGIVEPGEEPCIAAVREALEEAGVEIEVERLVYVGVTGPSIYPNGDRTNYLDHTFRARWVAGEAHVADDESRAVGWFDTDELPQPMKPRHRTCIEVALANPSDVVLGNEAATALLARVGAR